MPYLTDSAAVSAAGLAGVLEAGLGSIGAPIIRSRWP